jgi:UDP-N-acetylglucosamine acyltransferase
VPPFVMCMGNTVKPHGINVEGLKRRGFTSTDIADIKKAYKTLYRSSITLSDAVTSLELQERNNPKLGLLVDFLKTRSGRGIIR